MKTLSIIIPHYNKGNQVITLLKQLYEQIHYIKEVEVIVIDDLSSDGSREAIKEYIDSLEYNPFIYKMNEENVGPGVARNYGLDLSSGEWITFIDSDDEIMPNYIGTLFNYIDIYNDADLIGFDYEAVNCINDEELEYSLNTMVWTKLFRAEIFNKYHIRLDEKVFKGLVFGEDFELLALYMSKTDKYIKTHDKLIKYNWGLGISNYRPERYGSTLPEELDPGDHWMFKYNQSDITLDFNITNHCNRRCQNCIAMMACYKDEDRRFATLQEIEDRLRYTLPYVGSISILGGETLLHPDLLEIVKMIKNSGLLSIYIYTNGEIEPDNLQEVINQMDSRFTIRISKYPGSKIFDYTKYKMPFGVKWWITETDWFDCGKPVENNLPKTARFCPPKTCININNKVYLCQRMAAFDQLGIIKLADNEWCYVEDFKEFHKTFNQDEFTETCKYCLVGTDECKDIPSGS